MRLRPIASLACTALFAVSALAQGAKPAASPAESASAHLKSGSITVKYGAPSMRGRKIMGELVPYGKVWRTGANEATSLVTTTALKIGGTSVPAGSYTLFTLPSEGQWLLIVNKQTGEWGLDYHEDHDLARIPMKSAKLAAPQEKMSISFENTSGNSTELHVKWENADESVAITAQ
ncbi:MAG: DUF2911 domain-containing protein [Acidobacteria bacterium]|nr:DUF2911 domain-containing protein [Acidobacteriota bacterium]